jgi:hypothetical protein
MRQHERAPCRRCLATYSSLAFRLSLDPLSTSPACSCPYHYDRTTQLPKSMACGSKMVRYCLLRAPRLALRHPRNLTSASWRRRPSIQSEADIAATLAQKEALRTWIEQCGRVGLTQMEWARYCHRLFAKRSDIQQPFPTGSAPSNGGFSKLGVSRVALR